MFSTIITAAGKPDSSYQERFEHIPKNLVITSGIPILARAVQSYSSLESGKTVVVVDGAEEESHLTSAELSKYCKDVEVEPLSSPVRGALISAIVGSAKFPLDEPLIVAGGDSEIISGIRKHVQSFVSRNLSAGVIVFKDIDPRWSYVQLGRGDEIIQVWEKKVIGELATTGVFYFESTRKFLDAAEWCLVNNAQTGGVFYVSAALNHVIARGGKVGYEEIPRSQYRNYRFAEDIKEGFR